ncbi:MAG: leucine-rich repeat domain-containing protein [Lachnospiraceae bacterium]|nr:leucine-rich repeat domain-containing protein [Lachnospiraceae bacterium]
MPRGKKKFIIEDGVLTCYNGSDAVVEVPDSVEVIGASVFEDCAAITSVVLPESLLTIEAEAFARCRSLKTIRFPASLREIGCAAFSNCINLVQIEFPEKLMDYGTYDFEKEFIRMHLRMTGTPQLLEISPYAFENCISLTSVKLPEGVVNIGQGTFLHCCSLVSVRFPASLYRITDCFSMEGRADHGVFEGCTALKAVELPERLAEIGGESTYSEVT